MNHPTAGQFTTLQDAPCRLRRSQRSGSWCDDQPLSTKDLQVFLAWKMVENGYKMIIKTKWNGWEWLVIKLYDFICQYIGKVAWSTNQVIFWLLTINQPSITNHFTTVVCSLYQATARLSNQNLSTIVVNHCQWPWPSYQATHVFQPIVIPLKKKQFH